MVGVLDVECSVARLRAQEPDPALEEEGFRADGLKMIAGHLWRRKQMTQRVGLWCLRVALLLVIRELPRPTPGGSYVRTGLSRRGHNRRQYRIRFRGAKMVARGG